MTESQAPFAFISVLACTLKDTHHYRCAASIIVYWRWFVTRVIFGMNKWLRIFGHCFKDSTTPETSVILQSPTPYSFLRILLLRLRILYSYFTPYFLSSLLRKSSYSLLHSVFFRSHRPLPKCRAKLRANLILLLAMAQLVILLLLHTAMRRRLVIVGKVQTIFTTILLLLESLGQFMEESHFSEHRLG